MTFTREQVSFMQERIQAWCRNSPHTITKGDVFSLLTGARLEVEEKPKYDPCRKLKKGDKVKPRIWCGRVPSARFGAARIIPEQRIYEVFTDERHEFVKLLSGDDVIEMHVCHLELVTPVEEMCPYTLEEETAYIDDEECGILHIYYNYNGGRDKVRTFYENGPESWNAIKAAAEAECARLNAEHRKEQNNGNQ